MNYFSSEETFWPAGARENERADTQLHSPYWLFFTAFVGLNLFQSAFSNWCPMITFLRKLGVRED